MSGLLCLHEIPLDIPVCMYVWTYAIGIGIGTGIGTSALRVWLSFHFISCLA